MFVPLVFAVFVLRTAAGSSERRSSRRFAPPAARLRGGVQGHAGHVLPDRLPGPLSVRPRCRVGRLQEFALPEHQRPLCPGEHRELQWTYQYLWTKRSPLWDVRLPPGQEVNDVAGRLRPPRDPRPAVHLRPNGRRGLAPDLLADEARPAQGRVPGLAVAVPARAPDLEPPARLDGRSARGVPPRLDGRRDRPRPRELPADVSAVRLSSQGRFWPRASWSPWRRPSAWAEHERQACEARSRSSWRLGVVLCVGSVASTMFAWRYQLPQLILLPPAAALGITALLGWRRSGGRRGGPGSSRLRSELGDQLIRRGSSWRRSRRRRIHAEECARHDSNMRPLPPQGSALSPELRARGGQCSGRAIASPTRSSASSGHFGADVAER